MVLICKILNIAHELTQFLNYITAIHAGSQIKSATIEPGKLLSMNISSITAGVRKQDGSITYNMIPGHAQATIDIRVPPTMKKKDIIDMLDKKIKQYSSLSYVIVAQADEEPDFIDTKTVLYNNLEKAIRSFGYDVIPHYFEASSDLRFILIKVLIVWVLRHSR